MRTKANAILALLILVAVSTGIFVYWGNQKEEPGRVASTTKADGGAETEVGLHPKDDVQDSRVDNFQLQKPVLGEVDEATAARLRPWLDDVFLANRDLPESIMRTKFVAVDAQYIEQELTQSLQAAQIDGDNTGTRITLNLFPDRTYDIITSQYRLGSTGFKNFRTSVVGASGFGRKYFQFEISPEGTVYGRGITAAGSYLINPTPDPAVLLVVEIDMNIFSNSIRLE